MANGLSKYCHCIWIGLDWIGFFKDRIAILIQYSGWWQVFSQFLFKSKLFAGDKWTPETILRRHEHYYNDVYLMFGSLSTHHSAKH